MQKACRVHGEGVSQTSLTLDQKSKSALAVREKGDFSPKGTGVGGGQ